MKVYIVNQLRPSESSYTSRIQTSTIRLALWNGAWVAATALMAYGPKILWTKASVFTLLAVGLNVAVGVGLVMATKKYIAEQDELQQKVYLNALGITVGVAVIVGIPYSVMADYNVISFEADIGHLVILMGLTFAVSYLYGASRYR